MHVKATIIYIYTNIHVLSGTVRVNAQLCTYIIQPWELYKPIHSKHMHARTRPAHLQ